MELERTWT
jgi:hypothetical protein